MWCCQTVKELVQSQGYHSVCVTSYYLLLICLLKRCVHEPDQTYCKTIPLIFPLVKTRWTELRMWKPPKYFEFHGQTSVIQPPSAGRHKLLASLLIKCWHSLVVPPPTSLYDVLGSLCCINTRCCVSPLKWLLHSVLLTRLTDMLLLAPLGVFIQQ